MRSRVLALLLAASLACAWLTPAQPTALPPTATATLPAATATTPPPTLTPVPVPTATVTPASRSAFHLTPDDVHLHPDPQLYSGDIVSVEVVADDAPANWLGAQVRLYHGPQSDPPLAQVDMRRSGLGNRLQATFTWVWDTHGLEGLQTLTVVVDLGPGGPGTPEPSQSVTVTADLLPADTRPMPEARAEWATAESKCCIFHYLTDTAADRDIDKIKTQADAAFAHVEDVLGVQSNQKMSFTLLSRLLGQGGFAAGEISLTYIDRNPADGDLFSLFAHESTHVLDRKFAPDKPTIMAEGLAVYVAGGHFKKENLNSRAAAALALGRYIPLADLATSFYPAQHELGYLEGGAFIQYLVDRYGWLRFKGMYASFQKAPTEAGVLDGGLQVTYGRSLAAMEAEWLDYLRSLPRDQAEMDDLRLTIKLFDSMRRYQLQLDPSAYFLNAWLPDGSEGRAKHITADFVRHPTRPENIALETMLTAASAAINAGEFQDAGSLLEGVNAALDAKRLDANPLSAEYLQVVDQALEDGYEPQAITLDGEAAAQIVAIHDWPHLEELSLVREAGAWRLAASPAPNRVRASNGIIRPAGALLPWLE